MYLFISLMGLVHTFVQHFFLIFFVIIIPLLVAMQLFADKERER